MSDESKAVLILASFSTRDEAERVGEALVVQRKAACGSVVPNVHSFYYWDGKLQRESEALLLVKTTADRQEEVETYIQREGTYEVPELLCIRIDGGLPAYLEWLVRETRPDASR